MVKKLLIGILVIVIAIIGISMVLAHENALVFHPKGIIAEEELQLIVINILLMLLIIVPTFLFLFTVVWKYCIKKEDSHHDPNHNFGLKGDIIIWGAPCVIVLIMAIVTWNATHRLNPYKPIESEVKPLIVQVVALDWKWLFIYPELGIASLNDFHIPEKTPIHLMLTADASPMNSFWIPQLSGQIYSMTGMSTQLHLMAKEVGEYVGRAVEINGEGYADMTFPVTSSSETDFEKWVMQVKKSHSTLTKSTYQELVKPALNKSKIYYSEIEENLYKKIIHKYMYPSRPVL